MGLAQLVPCIGLFLAAEVLSWKTDVRRNPDRYAIRSRAVLYRVEPVRVHHARTGGSAQKEGFRRFKLVARDRLTELSHVIPGTLFLLADWYRYPTDVQLDFVIEESGPGAIRRTITSGAPFDEVWLMASTKNRQPMWDAPVGAAVRTGSGLSSIS